MMRGFVFSKPTCSAMTESVSEPQEQSAALPADPPAAARRAASAGANASGPAPPQPPLWAHLAKGHPTLFGDRPLPLKRGIFGALLAAHPEPIARAQLKRALSQHPRSSRYLTV